MTAAVWSRLKDHIKPTPLAVPFFWAKRLFTRPKAQNEEEEVLQALVASIGPAERFIEFGFSGWEFNCARLAKRWEGLLIDGDPYNVRIAHRILPRRVEAWHRWLTLDSMQDIADWANGREVGVLSVDVDGNDFWFLERLLPAIRPQLVIAEYNSTFGKEPLTTPYADDFDRDRFPAGAYFGASLEAITRLAERFGYQLCAVVPSGVNAFFVRTDLAKSPPLRASEAFVEHHRADGTADTSRFAAIADLPLVRVGADGKPE